MPDPPGQAHGINAFFRPAPRRAAATAQATAQDPENIETADESHSAEHAAADSTKKRKKERPTKIVDASHVTLENVSNKVGMQGVTIIEEKHLGGHGRTR